MTIIYITHVIQIARCGKTGCEAVYSKGGGKDGRKKQRYEHRRFHRLAGVIVPWIVGPYRCVVLSAVGRSQAVNNGGKTGLATAGIVLGIIGAAYCWIMMIIALI